MGTIRNRPHSIQEGSMVAIEDDSDGFVRRWIPVKGEIDLDIGGSFRCPSARQTAE